MSFAWTHHLAPALALATALGLAACSGVDTSAGFPERQPGERTARDNTGKPRETIFGPGGIGIGVNRGPAESDGAGAGIGVNSFLWRASLDTVGFMPLASADPFGGVIITDWYSPPGTNTERFKVTVYILDRRLRADGVKVAVFKEARPGPDYGWNNEAVSTQTVVDLENAILTRARQLRIEAAAR
ncbi:MAG: DUF3576 domain-containing protein [Alphaproteobacteria bacterium]|nr:DUF3576 domain-containing protein [Alphaproteobacteria bacterium]